MAPIFSRTNFSRGYGSRKPRRVVGALNPVITSPTNGEIRVDFTPTFTASGTNETHTTSDWQVATDSAFTTIIRSTTNDSTNKTSWSITDTRNGLVADTTYYLRVRFKNDNEEYSPYSSTVSFSTYSQLGSADTPVVSGGSNTTISTPASTLRAKVMVYGKNGNPGVPGVPNTPQGGAGGYARATFDNSGAITYAVYGVSGGTGGNGNPGGQGILFGPNVTLTSNRPSIWLAGGGGGGGGYNTGNQNARGGSGGGNSGGTGTNISESGVGGVGGSQNAVGPGGSEGGSPGSGFNGGNAGGNGGGGGGGWYGGGSGGPAGSGSLGGGGGSGRLNMPAPVNPSNTVNTNGLPTNSFWQTAYDTDHLSMTAGTVRIIYYG